MRDVRLPLPSVTRLVVACGLVGLAIVLGGPAADGGEPRPFTARAGLDLAADAARTWAADAELVYLENDEPLAADGTAARWGYLFRSRASGESRAYTLRDGRVLEASDLDFDLDAPPLPDTWLDSAAVLAAAEKEAGARFRAAHGGRVGTMFLIRGALHEKKPDRGTWAVVYTAPDRPNLLVIVDAASGDVVRTWEG